MTEESASYSSSGVRIADDYRDNLIIDRYDVCFGNMRESKKKHLRSENSEDALSWNVFRSLSQIEPEKWLDLLANKAFGDSLPGQPNESTIQLWKDVPPPPALLITGDEGISEIDIVLENPEWVWFIEAKYKSDISERTTTRPTRDQILRNIDVGSYYAGVRSFYFSLLCVSSALSPKGIVAVDKYRDPDVLKTHLPHRTDDLSNIRGVGTLFWADIAEIMKTAASCSGRSDEAIFAERAVTWMEAKGVTRTD